MKKKQSNLFIDMTEFDKYKQAQDDAWEKALGTLNDVTEMSDDELLKTLKKNYKELLFGKNALSRWEASCRGLTCMDECHKRGLSYEKMLDPLTEKYMG